MLEGRKGFALRTEVSGITTDLSGAGSHLVDRRGSRNLGLLVSPLEAKEATVLSKMMRRLVLIEIHFGVGEALCGTVLEMGMAEM